MAADCGSSLHQLPSPIKKYNLAGSLTCIWLEYIKAKIRVKEKKQKKSKSYPTVYMIAFQHEEESWTEPPKWGRDLALMRRQMIIFL